MKLAFAELPFHMQRAYQVSALSPQEARSVGAAVTVEAETVVDNSSGTIYTTYDRGQSFEIERVDAPRYPDDIVVRRVLRILDISR